MNVVKHYYLQLIFGTTREKNLGGSERRGREKGIVQQTTANYDKTRGLHKGQWECCPEGENVLQRVDGLKAPQNDSCLVDSGLGLLDILQKGNFFTPFVIYFGFFKMMRPNVIEKIFCFL